MKGSIGKNQLVKTNSIFYKIKKFFIRLFNKSEVDSKDIGTSDIKENSNTSFIENIRKIEDKETKLLKLQKQYRNGEIKEEDLTEEQIDELCKLYHKQISTTRKANEIRKQKILEYKRSNETGNFGTF